MIVPVVEFKAWSPVRGPEECLQCTGQIYKHVAHQEEPVGKIDKNSSVSYTALGNFHVFSVINHYLCIYTVCMYVCMYVCMFIYNGRFI